MIFVVRHSIGGWFCHRYGNLSIIKAGVSQHNRILFWKEKANIKRKKREKIKILNSATKKIIQMQFGIWEFERISSLKYFLVNDRA